MEALELNLTVEETTLYESAEEPANGDPFVAVVMQTNENDVTVEREPIFLGTDFESIDEVATRLRRFLTSPTLAGHDVDFVPDRADIFTVAGSVDFEPVTSSYEVEIESETYTVAASSKLDAKHRAASQHKEALSGPDIGRGVEELAIAASVMDIEPHPASLEKNE
jgi:hypothetical protein